MTPSARVQAAIDLLDEIITAARESGAAADTLIARYFKARRYAGSKDRRAVRELVYRAIRLCGERPESGRAAMMALAQGDEALLPLFDGSTHGPAPIAPDEAVAQAGIVPSWLLPYLADMVGDEAEQAALLERAPLDVRINALKADMDVLHTAFPDAQSFEAFPQCLRLKEGAAVEQSEPYRQGMVEIQDLGSQIIAQACAVQPGMTVIDLCAGAGGKTLALASAMAGQGRLIAADVNRDRLSRLPQRAERAGVTIIESLLLNPGKEAAALEQYSESADIVLVDAPCSGTGTWRRNPEARWRLTPQRIERLTVQQAHILDCAAPLVKPGGRLVYAVCALTDAEGCEQVDAFLKRHDGWKSEAYDVPKGRKCGEGRLLTPAHDGTDGFFIATLVRI